MKKYKILTIMILTIIMLTTGCKDSSTEIQQLEEEIISIQKEIFSSSANKTDLNSLERDVSLLEKKVNLLLRNSEVNDGDLENHLASTETKGNQEHTSTEVHWSYEDQTDWEVGYGDKQSPINIITENVVAGKSLQNIVSDFTVEPSYILDNGHSITVGAEGNSSVINGRTFNLLQFHYHSLSEHTINGIHTPLEVHFVHLGEDGRLAVIGVMIEEGQFNGEFEKVLNNIAAEKQENLGIILDYSELIPENKGYYHYIGSLTTPPLTENVEWYILKETIEISKEQINKFNEYYSANNREVQELEGRIVTEYE